MQQLKHHAPPPLLLLFSSYFLSPSFPFKAGQNKKSRIMPTYPTCLPVVTIETPKTSCAYLPASSRAQTRIIAATVTPTLPTILSHAANILMRAGRAPNPFHHPHPATRGSSTKRTKDDRPASSWMAKTPRTTTTYCCCCSTNMYPYLSLR